MGAQRRHRGRTKRVRCQSREPQAGSRCRDRSTIVAFLIVLEMSGGGRMQKIGQRLPSVGTCTACAPQYLFVVRICGKVGIALLLRQCVALTLQKEQCQNTLGPSSESVRGYNGNACAARPPAKRWGERSRWSRRSKLAAAVIGFLLVSWQVEGP